MSVTQSSSNASEPRPRWRQFSVRSLLLLILVLALVLAGVRTKLQSYGIQRAAVAKFEKIGAYTDYSFGNVIILDVYGVPTDAELAQLSELKKLQILSLAETTITESDLHHFDGLNNLVHLWVKKKRASTDVVNELRKKLPRCTIQHD